MPPLDDELEPNPTNDLVEQQLDEIIDPCSKARGTNHSIIDMGLLKSIDIDDGHVTIKMRLTSPLCFMVPYFIRKTEEKVTSLPGVTSVTLETDTGMEWTPDMMSDEAKSRRSRYLKQLEEHYRSTAQS